MILKALLALIGWIGPKVLRAWAYVLQDETGKFYAKYRGLFLELVKQAGAKITEDQVPDFWERRKMRAQFIRIEMTGLLMKDLGQAVYEIPPRLVFAAIEAAVAEVKGGWVK